MRLDVYLFENGFCESREQARKRILSGDCLLNGVSVTKPGTAVTDCDKVELTGEGMRFVSRAGDKLQKAVTAFGLTFDGLVCLDAGASTGGFTDCMLQYGAKRVYAVDVGTGQLHEKLKNDTRVVSLEKTDIRNLSAQQIGGGADFLTADLSFISLTKVLPVLYGLLKTGGRAVCLIKPQFEAGRAAIGKNGVVKDKKTHVRVLIDVLAFAAGTGFLIKGLTFSPVRGGSGNIEYLFYAVKTGNVPESITADKPERIVDEAFLYHS